jgi:hypothetical protein
MPSQGVTPLEAVQVEAADLTDRSRNTCIAFDTAS